MKTSHTLALIVLAAGTSACTGQSDEAITTAPSEAAEEHAVTNDNELAGEAFEIAPGLSATIVKKGHGRVAEVGDFVNVHYTGWLYDEQAEDNRGDLFDSSVSRNEQFSFKLGAGQVIKGWDQGVAGMLIGEKRVLTLAPEMGYGSRGAGDVIPPDATLIFDVELFSLESSGD